MPGTTAVRISDPPILWTATVFIAASALLFLIWPLSTFTISIQARTVAIAAIGTLAGLHGASYGAWKDSPHESFLPRRFLRELVIASLTAVLVSSFSASGSQCFFVLFLTVFTLTRVVTEFWKLFVRVEPQEDFRIPTQFHCVHGVVNRRWLRLLAGAGFLASIYGMYCLFTLLPPHLPQLVRGLIVGAGFGLTEAIAGAYKDGTIEGFSTLKFFKSPVFCAIGGFIAAFHTHHVAFLMLAAYGTNRMMLELFFKLLVPGYAPGKFRSMTGSFTEWNRRRNIFLLPYGVTWLFWLGLLFF